MLIANPLYDVVFKYLLEDTDIVRELLSTILGEEIISVEFKPQEMATESMSHHLFIMRFDFKAVIKTAQGTHKKILIELQKAKQELDVVRFRRYLGDNYRREEELILQDGSSEKHSLPIVTIYILGFRLDHILQPAVKINREYRDAITQELIDVKEDFVELLTHDSYFIQVPRLQRQTRTRLESALQVFSQDYRTEDHHLLDFKGDDKDPLVKKMIERLIRARGSDEMRDKMDLEDDLDRMFDKKDKTIAEKDVVIAEKDSVIAEKDSVIAEKDSVIAEKEKAIEAERLRNEALLQEIEALKRPGKL